MVTIGSAGDVYPFVGLGIELKQRDHLVTVITNPYFKPVIERAGLSFIPLGTVDDYRATIGNPDLWHPRKGFEMVARFGILPSIKPVFEIISRYDHTETIVVASALAFGARLAQEKHKLRLATVHLQPALFRSVYKPPKMATFSIPEKMPHFLKRLIFEAIDFMLIDRMLAPELNAFRTELGLPPVRHLFGKWIHSPQLVIGLFPDWFANPQPDWPNNTKLTGFIQYDQTDSYEGLSPEILKFLDKGDSPIVFTLGTAMQHGKNFFEASTEACRLLSKRALLLTQHPSHLPPKLPETIKNVEYIPFSKVLPYAATLVHHGGIGTTAQGLAAGIPQLVMPMNHDQPDNAVRIEKLGVGTSLKPNRYRGKTVASKLDYLLHSPQVQVQCQKVAKKVNSSEALTNTCLAIEELAYRK
ncbi:MAG TPA: nucleotide disphospho-sugar-binding domain-containing protein [Thermodesulfobacteriota bacterium]|nr:nucleotide disphospho-sugar-binding domain-containing protein [Thermodesulfobacteriota bacterium]